MRSVYFFLGSLAYGTSSIATETEIQIFREHNALRENPKEYMGNGDYTFFSPKQKAVEQLWWHDGLYVAAKLHCEDAGADHHTGSDGSTPFERMKRLGKYSITAGEIIEHGNSDPAKIVKKLYKHHSNRRNMMKTMYKEVGIAQCEVPEEGLRTVFVYAGKFETN